MSESHYQSLGGMSSALEQQAKRSKRSKIIAIVSIVTLVILVAVGVTVGVVVSNNAKERSASGNSGNSNSGSGNSTTGGTSSGDDPSVFTKDERLHKAFYGMAYTPDGALPDYGCATNLESVIRDMQILSQLTSRIRLYASDCNQTGLVLEAIKQTKIDMQVYLGNYVVDGDPGAYERQRDVIKAALETYGPDHVAGITVGNEFMLNYVTQHDPDLKDPNGAIANVGAQVLLANIEDTKKMVAELNLSKHIPIGNSDAGSYFSNQVLEAVEYGMSNVHAWFAQVTAAGAAAWVNQFFDEQNVQHANSLPNKPKMYIAETGWPTDAKDALTKTNGPGTAEVSGLQTFMDTFVCQANAAGVGYFFFEYKDEEWKDVKYGGVEGHWGLFNKDYTLKDVKIPDCVSP